MSATTEELKSLDELELNEREYLKMMVKLTPCRPSFYSIQRSQNVQYIKGDEYIEFNCRKNKKYRIYREYLEKFPNCFFMILFNVNSRWMKENYGMHLHLPYDDEKKLFPHFQLDFQLSDDKFDALIEHIFNFFIRSKWDKEVLTVITQQQLNQVCDYLCIDNYKPGKLSNLIDLDLNLNSDPDFDLYFDLDIEPEYIYSNNESMSPTPSPPNNKKYYDKSKKLAAKNSKIIHGNSWASLHFEYHKDYEEERYEEEIYEDEDI